MGDKTPNIQNGNNVCFIGGPEAGNVRVVPESFGNHIKGDGDYLYRIWPFQIAGDKAVMYFAISADTHPIELLREMWREYSPAAQIKRDTGVEAATYQRIKASP